MALACRGRSDKEECEMCASGLPPFSRKCCSQQALADRLEVHSEGTGVSLVCAPGPAAAENRHRCCRTGDRGVEDVVPAEFGLGCLADKAAEGPFFPEHCASFGF